VTYSVVWKQQALDELRRVDRAVARRLMNKIAAFSPHPHHFAVRLTSSPWFKVRAGDWRIIIAIDEHKRVVDIIAIGHRSVVYKRL
jgi:mRNA interferase RelE/StbE